MENTNIGCGTCRDLLPLYTDGVTSDESNALVETHLIECEDCRAELERQKSILPIPSRSPKKAMRTVKQKLRTRRILIGVGSGLGAAALLFGLFLFLANYMIPVKSPPEDLQFSVVDGVFTATSEVDSMFTGGRLSYLKAEDGSDIFLVMMSMDNPIVRKLWPALSRIVYPPHNDLVNGIVYESNRAQGMKLIFNLHDHGPNADDPLQTASDFNLDGKGLWRVYFIQEQDYQKQPVLIDESTGKLTEESMQYATLVWEETIS